MPFLLLMPSFNQARFIREAVESCLAQTDKDWELWILDNSSDETPQVMAGYSDPRIRYFHEPRRMDPGACLNWMLDQAEGRDFAYIHTDNILHSSFVAKCREALSKHPLSLCYCGHRVIDEEGHTGDLDRRWDYDLGNVLGCQGLGVSFAATKALAEKVGGFSGDDLADDVLFCSSSFGLGPWTHLNEVLVDYRIHRESRTESGGKGKVLMAILAAQEKALSHLEARGLDPLEAMESRIQQLKSSLEHAAESEVDRLALKRWWSGPALNGLWNEKLLRLSGFGSRRGGIKSRPPVAGKLGLARWLWLRFRLRGLQRRISAVQAEFRSIVVALAWLRAKRARLEPSGVHVAASDPMTLWAAQWLRRDLGWEPVLAQGLGGVSTELSWDRGEARERDFRLGNPEEAMAPGFGLRI